ncbi:MAG TPA: hypothetical protein VLJ86_21120 [Ramlibacter sp.]|nr:hypothetical protein [Ramlibacter sp.]
MQTPNNSSAEPAAALTVEAARYALLRRLAFAMRHEMAAHLQPINMLGELLERRLRAPELNAAQVRDGVGKLSGFSKDAVHASLDLITWLSPDASRRITLAEAVKETLDLVRSSFGFRGFSLRDAVQEAGAASVQRDGIRYLLPACLLLLTDGAGAPAEVTITAPQAPGQACLRLELEPTDGPEGMEAELAYRALTRAEVALLAQAEGVAYSEDGDAITLGWPAE